MKMQKQQQLWQKLLKEEVIQRKNRIEEALFPEPIPIPARWKSLWKH